MERSRRLHPDFVSSIRSVISTSSRLEADARLVITDSGGVQEETTILGVPCLTYRTTTERPITVSKGTNRLVGLDPDQLKLACRPYWRNLSRPRHRRIPLWDGRAGGRAVEEIATFSTASGGNPAQATVDYTDRVTSMTPPAESHSRHVLITGGAGFIGSHLADALIARGDHVTALDDLSTGRTDNIDHLLETDHFELVDGSSLDHDLVDRLVRESDVCFHLASAVGVQLIVSNPLESLLKNVRGTDNVLSAAASAWPAPALHLHVGGLRQELVGSA